MTIRVWASPPVFIGDPETGAYNAKAAQYCTGYVNFMPTLDDGSPASTWVVTVGLASDWTAASADAQLRDVFAGDLPSAVDTIPEFKALLKNTTLSQLSVARRNAIGAHFDALGVYRGDFVGTTTMVKVFRRLVSACIEQDTGFATGFSF